MRIPLLAVLCLLFAASSQAHLLNMTKARAVIDGDGSLKLALELDLAREMGSGEAYYRFSRRDPQQMLDDDRWQRLVAAIDIRQGEQRLPLTLVAVDPPSDRAKADFDSGFNWPMTGLTLRGHLVSEQPLKVRFDRSFPFEEPISLSLRSRINDEKQSRWLVSGQVSPAFGPGAVPVAAPQGSPLAIGDLLDYLGFGFGHILPLGLDHLLFVLGLYLAARSRRQLFWQISVFTLAHTLTLGLASYRIIEPPAALVEFLIAASIFWVGIEILWRHEKLGTRLLVILGFGLLHGMGFASALAEGRPATDDFLPVLVMFNLGVELGQLTFIGLVALTLGWFVRRPSYRTPAVTGLAIMVLAVSALWMIQRVPL